LRASLPDRELAQFLDGLIKRRPGLLLEHFTEEATEKAHVSAQRPLFQVPIVAR
jgi:hypothetical protein